MEKNINAAVVIAAIQKEAGPLMRAVQKIEVEDNESYELLSQKIKDLKTIAKTAEAREKSLTDPLKKVISDIQSFFSPFYTRVEELEKQSKQIMLQFRKEQENKIAKVNNDLATGKIKKLGTAARKVNELQVTSTTSSVKKIWTLEEIDAAVTPREYLVPDETKIRAALKAGKKVLGWRIVQKDTIAI